MVKLASDESRLSTLQSRPSTVTLLALGGLSIGGINLLRFVEAVRQWRFLETLLGVHPLYLAASGLVWGTVWIVLTGGLWEGRRWAPLATRLAALAYSLYYWTDRLLLSAGGLRTNWPFSAGLNLLLLMAVFLVFQGRRERAFFAK